MGKDPAFLFYPSEWTGGTRLFTRAEKGAYMDLLMTQFDCGHMTGHNIAHVLGEDYEKMWEQKLRQKFKQDEDGLFYNEKLEKERVKRAKYVESRKNNNEGVNQYSNIERSYDQAMSGHSRNRNRNRNRNIDSNIKDSLQKFEFLWKQYPKQVGKKQSLKHFLASVKTDQDYTDIQVALANYCKTDNVVKGITQYIQNGSTWFNNWRDWVSMKTGIHKKEQPSAIDLLRQRGEA